MTLHSQQVIMLLAVDLAEKKSRIVDLENELERLQKLLNDALMELDRWRSPENVS